MAIPIVVPARPTVEALHRFLQDRGEEQWQQALTDENLPEERLDAVRRLNNSHRTCLAATAAAALHALGQIDATTELMHPQKQGRGAALQYRLEEAAMLWHALTSSGEQWNDHPAWNPAWRNPSRAALEASLL